MLSTKFKFICFAAVLISAAAILFTYPNLKGETASVSSDDASRAQINKYGQIANVISKCNTVNQVTEPTIKAPFSPAASLCINGSLAVADPDWIRPSNQTTGSGIPAGCPSSGVSVNHDVYSFNLSGCTTFPTQVTMTLCGPAGCLPIAGTDTVLHLYRNVAAGDPLLANGGLPNVFNPANPCTNLRAINNELNGGASSTNPTGNTCDQGTIGGVQCLPGCSVTTVSGFIREMGSGRFTLVVSGSGAADVGSYNLYVDAPGAGCTIAIAPTAANGSIAGRVTTSTGQGISNATLTVTGSDIAPMTLRTNAFGYYNFENIPTGGTYIVTVSSKTYTFSTPTRTVVLEDSAAGIDFVSEQ